MKETWKLDKWPYFFHLLFPLCFYHSFLYLKWVKIHFYLVPLLVHSGLGVDTLGLLKIHIVFCPLGEPGGVSAHGLQTFQGFSWSFELLGNSYIHFLMIITKFRFTCGDESFVKTWKSLQIFCPKWSEKFSSSFCFFEIVRELQIWSVFSTKK